MIGFKYEYTTSSDIMNNIKLLSEYSIGQYSILIFSILLLIGIIYYIIPSINIYITFRKKEKVKEKRSILLKQIVMQKDINSEIEKELDM